LVTLNGIFMEWLFACLAALEVVFISALFNQVSVQGRDFHNLPATLAVREHQATGKKVGVQVISYWELLVFESTELALCFCFTLLSFNSLFPDYFSFTKWCILRRFRVCSQEIRGPADFAATSVCISLVGCFDLILVHFEKLLSFRH
jgi:hypothetical protein